MNHYLKISVLFVLLLMRLSVSSQSYSELISQSLEQNDITRLLPALQTLIDSAILHSPVLKIGQSDMVIRKLRVLSENREWTRNIGFEAGIRYGLFDNLILKEQAGVEILQGSTSTQTRYNVGVFVKVPVSILIDRSNVKIAKEEEKQALYSLEQSMIAVRQAVILQYFDLIKMHKAMIIKNETVETYRVQMFRAEQDFINGLIGIAEYTRLKNMFTQAILDFEETKIDYLVAYQLLQEIVGISIEIIND
jgi:outer membrane protein TolC